MDYQRFYTILYETVSYLHLVRVCLGDPDSNFISSLVPLYGGWSVGVVDGAGHRDRRFGVDLRLRVR